MTDMVNQPPHYNAGGIEAIDAARAMAQGWEDDGAVNIGGFSKHCLLNAFKYIWRAPLKGDYRENVEKAIWYLRQAIGDDPREETQPVLFGEPTEKRPCLCPNSGSCLIHKSGHELNPDFYCKRDTIGNF